jgi:hypothetical protein
MRRTIRLTSRFTSGSEVWPGCSRREEMIPLSPVWQSRRAVGDGAIRRSRTSLNSFSIDPGAEPGGFTYALPKRARVSETSAPLSWLEETLYVPSLTLPARLASLSARVDAPAWSRLERPEICTSSPNPPSPKPPDEFTRLDDCPLAVCEAPWMELASV